MNDCPCKDCKDRYVGCHSKCNGYLEWSTKHRADLDEKNKQAEINAVFQKFNVERGSVISKVNRRWRDNKRK